MRLLALLFAGSVSAAPLAVVTAPDGSSVTLYDDAGPCINGAKLAVWVSPDAQKRVPGCYVASGGGVFVSFLDGDRADIPVGALKKPTSL